MKSLMKLVWLSWILKIVAIGALLIALYMVIDFGSSKDIMSIYGNLRPDTVNGFNKKLEFIETYTRLTGDYTLALDKGFSEDDVNEIIEGGTIQDNIATDEDWTAYAMEVVRQLGTTYSCNNYRRLSFANGNSFYGTPCCCCLVECTLANAGKIPSSTNSAFGHCGGLATNYGTSVAFDDATTFASLKVGDVFCYYGQRPGDSARICHVDMVIKIDTASGTVYIANGGSSNSLANTYNQGYAYTVNLNDRVKSTLESHYYNDDYIIPYQLRFIKRG